MPTGNVSSYRSGTMASDVISQSDPKCDFKKYSKVSCEATETEEEWTETDK